MGVDILSYSKTFNDIENRFLNDAVYQHISKIEWDIIKAELERRGRIEDAVKMTEGYTIENGMVGK